VVPLALGPSRDADGGGQDDKEEKPGSFLHRRFLTRGLFAHLAGQTVDVLVNLREGTCKPTVGRRTIKVLEAAKVHAVERRPLGAAEDNGVGARVASLTLRKPADHAG
jgi:hypothetical protein